MAYSEREKNEINLVAVITVYGFVIRLGTQPISQYSAAPIQPCKPLYNHVDP